MPTSRPSSVAEPDFTPAELLDIYRAMTALEASKRSLISKFGSLDSYARLCSSTSGLLMELIRAELRITDIQALNNRMDQEAAAIAALPPFTLSPPSETDQVRRP